MLQTAVQKEAAGQTAVYYWNKKEAEQLLLGAGLQLPGGQLSNGFIHKITDPDSPVNPTIDNQTQTKRFGRWFGNSKIVNDDGTPKIVYHGSSNEFNKFDMSKGRSNMDIQGSFFSLWEEDSAGCGENVKAFYLSIKNPAPEQIGYKALNMFKEQNNTGIKARNWLIAQGYDGVNNGDEAYIDFYPEQIKSPTDNVGTFDRNNRNVYYSLISDDDAAIDAEIGRLLRRCGPIE